MQQHGLGQLHVSIEVGFGRLNYLSSTVSNYMADTKVGGRKCSTGMRRRDNHGTNGQRLRTSSLGWTAAGSYDSHSHPAYTMVVDCCVLHRIGAHASPASVALSIKRSPLFRC